MLRKSTQRKQAYCINLATLLRINSGKSVSRFSLPKLPKTQMWLDYDEEADVLYLHFEDQPVSTRSQMRDDGVILDYKGRRLVGVTILEASQR